MKKTAIFCAIAGAVLFSLSLSLHASPSAAAGGSGADEPVLDRNGDGREDTIFYKRKAHYDVDFDGIFDFTLSLEFKAHATKGHTKYVLSGYDRGVFAEIMADGLDSLCQEERDNARWTEDNFQTFLYYHDGYGLLSLFSQSDVNDRRLTNRKHRGEYDYIVAFNPDGSIKTARRGEKKVALAVFDYKTNSATGKKVFLPKIESAGDVEAIRKTLDELIDDTP